MRKIRAAVLMAPRQALELVDDLTIDDPRPGEALVRIRACGLCHSDLSIIEGEMPYPVPVVLGHEAAGEIVELGGHSDDFAIGDRVVLSMRAPCDECYFCVRGQPVLCERGAAPLGGGAARLWRGDAPVARGFQLGAFAEYALVSLGGIAKLPETLDFADASVLGCAVQTGVGTVENVADCAASDSACVIGLGGVGLAMIMGLRARGVSRILGIDPLAERRARAEALGATLTVAPDALAEGSPLTEPLAAMTGGRGFDVVFDNVAATATSATALEMTRKGGHLVLVGVTGKAQPPGFSTMDLVMSQKRVSGAFLGNCHPRRDLPRMALDAVEGRLDLAALVTNLLPIEEINSAVAMMQRGEGVRSVLTF